MSDVHLVLENSFVVNYDYGTGTYGTLCGIRARPQDCGYAEHPHFATCTACVLTAFAEKAEANG